MPVCQKNSYFVSEINNRQIYEKVTYHH